MIFDKVVGHKSQIGRLKQVLQSQNLPSRTLLFCGPSGIGKKLIALGWAQGLLCENTNRPCGKCSSCQRIEKGQHPDLIQIGLTEGATLKIEQIRDVQKFVSLQSYEGRGQVVLIDDAQALTPQASNSLLKTLEEPSPRCNFVLMTSNRSAILPTIQSRCQKFLFGTLEVNDLKKILPETEDWILNYCQGRADLASKLNDEGFRKIRRQALKVLQDLPFVGIYEGFISLEELSKDRDSALFTLQCWGRLVTRAMVPDSPGILDSEERKVISQIHSHFNKNSLLKMGEKIIALEHDIQANINKDLAFERFWLDVKELKNVAG